MIPFTASTIALVIGALLVGAFLFRFFMRLWVPRMQLSQMQSVLNQARNFTDFKQSLNALNANTKKVE